MPGTVAAIWFSSVTPCSLRLAPPTAEIAAGTSRICSSRLCGVTVMFAKKDAISRLRSSFAGGPAATLISALPGVNPWSEAVRR